MKRTLIILTLAVIIFITGCFQENEHNKAGEIILNQIGMEGPIQNEKVAYTITDMSHLGFYGLAIKINQIERHLQADHYVINVSGTAYRLKSNPFDPSILETAVNDDKTLSAIREGKIKALDLSEKDDVIDETKERDDITLAHVIIEKEPGENGTKLYQISLEVFMSMRNAGLFVFNQDGHFLAPVYIKDSENNTYPLETFISARNVVAGSSVSEALTFLKNHPDHESFLAHVDSNRVEIEGGEIVIYSPDYKRLRDLGPEGPLEELNNVYIILDNTIVGYWTVSIVPERLPEPEKSGTGWQLVIRENEHTFRQNDYKPELYETKIPVTQAVDIETVRNAHFQKTEEILDLYETFETGGLSKYD